MAKWLIEARSSLTALNIERNISICVSSLFCEWSAAVSNQPSLIHQSLAHTKNRNKSIRLYSDVPRTKFSFISILSDSNGGDTPLHFLDWYRFGMRIKRNCVTRLAFFCWFIIAHHNFFFCVKSECGIEYFARLQVWK